MLTLRTITPLRVLRGLAARLRPGQPLVAEVVDRQVAAESAAVDAIASGVEQVEARLGAITAFMEAALADGQIDSSERATLEARLGAARAALRHQRLGATIRVAKCDLEKFGVVAARG